MKRYYVYYDVSIPFKRESVLQVVDYQEYFTDCDEGFDSLQTGKRIASSIIAYQLTNLNVVSIPFKRESVLQV